MRGDGGMGNIVYAFAGFKVCPGILRGPGHAAQIPRPPWKRCWDLVGQLVRFLKTDVRKCVPTSRLSSVCSRATRGFRGGPPEGAGGTPGFPKNPSGLSVGPSRLERVDSLVGEVNLSIAIQLFIYVYIYIYIIYTDAHSYVHSSVAQW